MPTLWPHMANAPVTETLEFMTDVLNANSAEQRIAMRRAPRQVIAYSWHPDEAEYSAAEQLVRSVGAGQWYAPVWFESVNVGALSSGAGSISVDVTDRDYRVGSRLVVWDSYTSAETVEISAISGPAITLNGTLSNSYTNATIAPVLTAYAAGGLDRSRSGPYRIKASIRFVSTDVADIGATTYDQYLSADVMTDRTKMLAEVTGGIKREVYTLDNGVGPQTLVAAESYDRPRNGMIFADDQTDRLTRRKWLYSLKGRQKHFWLPTWNADFTVTSSIGSGDTTISVAYATSQVDDLHVMLELTDGTRFYRQITASTANSITIDSSLGQAVTTAEIKVLCLLNKVRSETDRIQINHDGSSYSEIRLPVVGVA